MDTFHLQCVVNLFFNAKFDLSICYEYFNLPELPWYAWHDAMYLAFLDNPHARDLDLKSLAEALLGWPPEERDAIGDYVWENRKALKEAYPGSNISRSKGIREK
jgi:hypothetical protein